jgi:uncharacterized protein (TIGR02147 family)
MEIRAEKHAQPRAWDFTSTQEYVRGLDLWAKQHWKGYSRRAFASWGKIPSPNCLSLIVNGKRSLSNGWLRGFIRAAKLENTEATYLELLINLEQSTAIERREEILQKMHSVLNSESIISIVGDRLELIRNQNAWTLYHMLGLVDQNGDPFWFKSRLRQKISVSEIREALELLKRLKLVTELPSGALEAQAAMLESGDQFQSAENRIFHRFALEESRHALESIPIEQRNFGSLTITIPIQREEEFKEEVNRFGKKLLEKYGSAKRVHGNLFRINLQLYPLTQMEKHS